MGFWNRMPLFQSLIFYQQLPSNVLGITIILQIITGIFLGLHYTSDLNSAYCSVFFFVREIYYGWCLRYLHSSGASFVFLFLFLHLGRAISYGSYFSFLFHIFLFFHKIFLLLVHHFLGFVYYFLLMCILFSFFIFYSLVFFSLLEIP